MLFQTGMSGYSNLQEMNMSERNEFHTMKGYQLIESGRMSTAMEDYLEMMFRIFSEGLPIRVVTLSGRLQVKPSSVTKMVQLLSREGYVLSEKYGDIVLTERGKKAGEYFLYRHEIVCRFLCLLNNSENELEQAEKIEHFLKPETVKNLNRLSLLIESASLFNKSKT